MLYHGLPMSSTDTNIMVHTCSQELCVRPQHIRFRASSVALVIVLKALAQAGYSIIPPPPRSLRSGLPSQPSDESVDVFGPFTIEELQQYRSAAAMAEAAAVSHVRALIFFPFLMCALRASTLPACSTTTIPTLVHHSLPLHLNMIRYLSERIGDSKNERAGDRFFRHSEQSAGIHISTSPVCIQSVTHCFYQFRFLFLPFCSNRWLKARFQIFLSF
ncbi:hypothetical protein TSMEX_006525 [Taenia solium]|eukprot:TsM_001095400 transcript=TsM_001095400 gene=TsM_001095400